MEGWSRREKIGNYRNLINSLRTREKVTLYLIMGLIAFTVVEYVLSIYAVTVHAKGLKLYLTIGTNLPSQDIEI
jgi:hypothetical protein